MSVALFASNFKPVALLTNKLSIAAFDSGPLPAPAQMQSAKWLAALGIPVFPLNDNKRPFANAMIADILGIANPAEGQGGCKLATTDQVSIDKLWTALPNARIGIRTGKASGLYVLDIDRKNGKDGFASILANKFDLPNTPSEHTSSGGAHYYYRIPKDDHRHWKNDSSILGIGIDRKGDNGYVAWNGANLSQPMASPPTWMINDLSIERPVTRHRLGDPLLAAPSLAAAMECLNSLDPTERDDWFKRAAKFKQSAATVTDDKTAYFIFDLWSRESGKYDAGENRRQWDSIRDTEGGWDSLRKEALRCGGLTDDQRARMMLGAPTQDHPSLQQQPSGQPQPTLAAEQSLVGTGTHSTIATAFALRYGNHYRYNASQAQWLKWDDRRWKPILPEEMLGYVRKYCESTAGEKRQPQQLNFWQAVLKALTTKDEFLRTQTLFDRDNYLLNTPDGTIDLRTGERRPHNPADHITAMTSVSPSSTPSPIWTSFIDGITCGDQETACSLQIMTGAALSGAIEDHWISYFWGNGRNGKSVFIESVAHALGDYARLVPSDVFASTKHEQHPTGLTTMIGARLIYTGEVKEGAYFDTTTLNMISGDDEIEARKMRGDFFKFKRTFKLFMLGNPLPRIRTANVAIKSRMRIVPFRAQFAGREDKDLPARLRGEAGAVLRWLLEGHRAWLAAGKRFISSGAIQHATTAYFEAQSTTETWLAERAKIIKPDARLKKDLPTASMVYFDYKNWKEARNEHPISQTEFGIWLTMQEGVTKERSPNSARYRGIELIVVEHEVPPMPGQSLNVVPLRPPQ